MWFAVVYCALLFLLACLKNWGRFHTQRGSDRLPSVSIIIPAHNEEESIEETLSAALALDYPKELLEVIVVNDGSTDRTAEVAKKFADRGVILLNNPRNLGKAASLNRGVKVARGEIVCCLDADTTPEAGSLKKLVKYFSDSRVAAVVARIKVKGPKNLLQKLIDIEYKLGLGFYTKLLSLIGSLHMVPGQFSAYRKGVLEELGGFDESSVVEDAEIAYRLHKSGYKIACCLEAVAHTRVPSTLGSFYRQRRRWYCGTIQTLRKHVNVFFNPKLGAFGLFIPANYLGLHFLGVVGFYSLLYNSLVLELLNALVILKLIDFEIFEALAFALQNLEFDLLAVHPFCILGAVIFLLYLSCAVLGLKAVGERLRDNSLGFLLHLLYFVIYYLLWTASAVTLLLRRRVSWR